MEGTIHLILVTPDGLLLHEAVPGESAQGMVARLIRGPMCIPTEVLTIWAAKGADGDRNRLADRVTSQLGVSRLGGWRCCIGLTIGDPDGSASSISRDTVEWVRRLSMSTE